MTRIEWTESRWVRWSRQRPTSPAERRVNEHAVTVLLAEYDKLKAEQVSRISFRDNLLYATLAAGATVGAIAASAHMPLLLLLLPVATTALGWAYLVNDHAVSAIGRYIRDDLGPRLADLIGHDGALFGWEAAHRSDDRRRSRKLFQELVDGLVFVIAPLVAVTAGAVLSSPLSWWPLVPVVAAESLMISALGWQMNRYAETERPGGRRTTS